MEDQFCGKTARLSIGEALGAVRLRLDDPFLATWLKVART
jgi:hypothetical protein